MLSESDEPLGKNSGCELQNTLTLISHFGLSSQKYRQNFHDCNLVVDAKKVILENWQQSRPSQWQPNEKMCNRLIICPQIKLQLDTRYVHRKTLTDDANFCHFHLLFFSNHTSQLLHFLDCILCAGTIQYYTSLLFYLYDPSEVILFLHDIISKKLTYRYEI